MGKAAKVFAVCVFMMLLTACSVEQNIGFTESQSPTVKQEGKQQTIVLPYDGEKLSADPISAASFYREALTEARLPQISAYEVTDYIAVAEKWINSWYIADSFTEKYRTCDYVEAYPILGTYLE